MILIVHIPEGDFLADVGWGEMKSIDEPLALTESRVASMISGQTNQRRAIDWACSTRWAEAATGEAVFIVVDPVVGGGEAVPPDVRSGTIPPAIRWIAV